MDSQSRPAALAPTIVHVPRILWLLGVFVGFALGGTALCYALSGGGHLVCSRSEGHCTLTTWRGLESWGDQRDLKLANIVRAEFVVRGTIRQQKGGISETVEHTMPSIVLKSSFEDVEGGMLNVSDGQKQSFVDDVNAYLAASDRDKLDARREAWIPVLAVPFVWTMFVLPWVLVRTRVVIDKANRLVRVERGMFGMFATEIPLAAVVAADDGGGVQTVIVRTDGPPVPLMAPNKPGLNYRGIWSERADLERRGEIARRAAAEINEALARARD